MTTENLYMPDCIRTFTGKYVNVFDPKPEMFVIEDIAHSLAMQPRFGGHLPIWYSVADHCIGGAISILPDHAYDFLMHEAAEAYLLDLASPIKKRIPGYRKLEDGLLKVLSEVFGFRYPFTKPVKLHDKWMLEWEWEHMMLTDQAANAGVNLSPVHTEQEFLSHYKIMKQW